jgi:signal transduction histidine kinase
LGLYLAQRIAVAHGGALAVDSTLGQGARFTLMLPLSAADHKEQTLRRPLS